MKTEKDPELEVEVTTASTLQDAINAFVAKGRPNSDIIRRPEGYTVVAMGRGTYNPGYKNVVASRIEQRSAYVEAFMDAKGRMARKLTGMTVRGVTNFARRMDRVDTSERGLTNIDREVSETQNQTARKLLKGCVTYAVQDDPEKGQVLVTIVSSPKTRGKYDRPGPDGISTDSLRDGLNMVITEIRNGLVPPVGGRIIEVPGTGEMAWVGFGSAIVRKDDEPDVQEELNLAAEEIAGMRAVDALAGIILGDDTRWEGHADEQTRRQVRDFERLQASDPTFRGAEDEIRVYEQRKKTMRSDQRSNTKVQSLRRGVLPPGIDPQVEMDEDGYFAYGIAVYIPSVSEMARQASREMDEAEIVRSPNSRGSRQQQNLKMKKGPSGIVEQNL